MLLSCGMEDYKYLQPIDSGNITMELNSRAIVRLPYINTDNYYYFRNFVIYYRIYISDISISGQVSQDELNRLNTGLYNDYWALQPYTALDNNRSPSAMGSVFSGRKYFPLAVQGASIDSVLGTGALPSQGSTTELRLDFAQVSSTTYPSLTIKDVSYNLYRNNDSTLNRPIPSNRYFLNSSDLQNPANISTTELTNMDVQNKEGISGQKYTYASMYILLVGTDDNLTTIYSAPSFIGIFRLPD
jgi:uncharacterized membrane protein